MKPKPSPSKYLVGVTLLVAPWATGAFQTPNLRSRQHASIPRLSQSLDVGDQDQPRRGFKLRRAFRKVLKRRRERRKDSVFAVSQKEDAPGKASTAMQMTVQEMAETDTESNMNLILGDFDLLTPRDVFPNLTADDVAIPFLAGDEALLEEVDGEVLDDEQLYEDLILDIAEAESEPQSPKADRAAVVNRVMKGYFENTLHALLLRWSIEPPQKLTVDITPKGNVMSRLLRGKFKTDAEISFNKLVFRPFQLSGGSVEAKRLLLNLWSFTPDLLRQGLRRYPAQFDFYFNDCTFTEEDLIRSRGIRNGLQRLLARILRRAGVTSNEVTVKSIKILPSGKISCSGEASTTFSTLPFEVRSGISLGSRGHVVTFPGLEVSLQPSLGLFMPVVPEIDLDVGHNARLLSVDINGFLKTLTINAKATVTPEHTLKLKEYFQTTESYSAHFTFDVGKWLTKVGNFTG